MKFGELIINLKSVSRYYLGDIVPSAIALPLILANFTKAPYSVVPKIEHIRCYTDKLQQFVIDNPILHKPIYEIRETPMLDCQY